MPDHPSAAAAAEPPFPGFLIVAVVLALVAALVSARPAALAPAAAPPPAVARVAEADLLTVYGCTACHAVVAGADAETGPTLAGAVARGAARLDNPAYTGAATDVTGWLAESIADHCADETPGWTCTGVDPYGNWLSLEEVARLADLVAALPVGP